jgi:hypothetical protein
MREIAFGGDSVAIRTGGDRSFVELVPSFFHLSVQ